MMALHIINIFDIYLQDPSIFVYLSLQFKIIVHLCVMYPTKNPVGITNVDNGGQCTVGLCDTVLKFSQLHTDLHMLFMDLLHVVTS